MATNGAARACCTLNSRRAFQATFAGLCVEQSDTLSLQRWHPPDSVLDPLLSLHVLLHGWLQVCLAEGSRRPERKGDTCTGERYAQTRTRREKCWGTVDVNGTLLVLHTVHSLALFLPPSSQLSALKASRSCTTAGRRAGRWRKSAARCSSCTSSCTSRRCASRLLRMF